MQKYIRTKEGLQIFLSNLKGVRPVDWFVYNSYERKRGKDGTESLQERTAGTKNFYNRATKCDAIILFKVPVTLLLTP